MVDTSLDMEDYYCSVCREIFDNPVSLPCSHSFCKKCCSMLKDSSSLTPAAANHEQYRCAICREVASSFHCNRELDERLSTVEVPCQYCSKFFILKELQKHMETCTARNDSKPPSRPIVHLSKSLSENQQKALEQAQAGENRSTFTCPFCPTLNLTCTDLSQHIKNHHIHEDQRRVYTFVNYTQDEQQMMDDAIQASLKEYASHQN
ncbi:unnamed protein product [Didymodactylos carnosus]|uniref:RING-type domain-containing protein n=1 Tax=Didymodactylos carnosus TaxID=1234261 RepID=A0A814DPT5_9BILA|nr:unnamed protein product [Didymodactylos carnosus]CAF3735789.1 unnamed protein product [Didymodactylos carnosus]